MKKNLAVDVPRDAETEVDRIRGLKKSIFTRTRIACLCLVMVLALSVSSTLAYEKWSGNATPNRGTFADVNIKIGEKTSISAADSTYKYDSEAEGTYSYGKNNKVVRITASNQPNEVESNVFLTIVPEVESKGYTTTTSTDPLSGALLTFDEELSAPTYEGGEWYMQTSVLRVYLNNDWQSKWSYITNKGVFQYKTPLAKGESTDYLVRGVVLQDEVNASDYKSVKVTVIAKGVAISIDNTSGSDS